jgi:hypothetical protein
MKIYSVAVRYTVVKVDTIEVNANDAREARRIAESELPDFDFSTSDVVSEEAIIDPHCKITEVKP